MYEELKRFFSTTAAVIGERQPISRIFFRLEKQTRVRSFGLRDMFAIFYRMHQFLSERSRCYRSTNAAPK